MKIPIATYRLQFTPSFGLADAQAIAPYLSALGISDIYASPILHSRQGSTHGYDGVDPNHVDPELGGDAVFEALGEVLRSLKLGWVQDIVPNHMAFSCENSLLMDVMEKGRPSQYSAHFDIDWQHPYEGMTGRVLAPFLGQPYGDCLAGGELTLAYGETGFTINYYALKFPLCLASYTTLLTHDLAQLEQQLGQEHSTYQQLQSLLENIEALSEVVDDADLPEQVWKLKAQLWQLWGSSNELRQHLDKTLQTFNGKSHEVEPLAHRFALLDQLLSQQFYRLAYWKVSTEELNYRRFFTINDLICLQVEDEAVFQTVHQTLLDWVKAGKITGLRVDHIDGLYDPLTYLNRLRQAAPEAYLLVEKILEAEEVLPTNWPIQGTTGYDFMNQLNGVLCDRKGEATLTQTYQDFIGTVLSSSELIEQNKRLIVAEHMAGDVDNLVRLLRTIAGRDRASRDITLPRLQQALEEVLVLFPVYRSYINQEGVNTEDQSLVQGVIRQAKLKLPTCDKALSFLERVLLLQFDEDLSDEDQAAWLRFSMRVQQYTGPVMAKGVEDTAFYLYNRLTSLNEVGAALEHFGVSPEGFHQFNQTSASHWPHRMNATATHDTKRGEDTRARINVISELADEWREQVSHWQQLNHRDHASSGEAQGHDLKPNDEYFIYQTLVGVFPFITEDMSIDEGELVAVANRVKDYLVKSVREAKVNSNWENPDEAYEASLARFVNLLLDRTQPNPFLDAFMPFARKVQHHGLLNSLSQTLLKFTVPGLPDVYQGTELWDFSLVDPDNRRPVDYGQRTQLLEELQQQETSDRAALIQNLRTSCQDGRIKLYMTYKLLQARQQLEALFQQGTYLPLELSGELREQAIAFERRLGDQRVIAIAPRLTTALTKEGEFPLGESVWGETGIQLSQAEQGSWQNLLTGDRVQAGDTLWLKDMLKQLPIALLVYEQS